jgi:methylmalonyl-CoA/ethylmalonyl-CoA epimerase
VSVPLVFHHIGVACRDLDAETAELVQLGYVAEGPDFHDPIQKVSGRFLVGNGPRLELLIAHPGASVLDPWLRNGTKLYHQAFETPALAKALEDFCGRRARVVVEPVPAVAFGGRRIAFVVLRTMMLVELIEAAP